MEKTEIIKELINLGIRLKEKSKMKIFNERTRESASLQASFVEQAVESLIDGLDLKLCSCGEVFERRNTCYFGTSDFCESCVARQERDLTNRGL